jgi:hypothetical protein
MSPSRVNTGLDARMLGKEKGVQFPPANALVHSVPSAANRAIDGVSPSGSRSTASARNESTVIKIALSAVGAPAGSVADGCSRVMVGPPGGG